MGDLIDKATGRVHNTLQLYQSQPLVTRLLILAFLAVHLGAFIFFVFVLGPEKVFDYTAQLARYIRTLSFPRLTLISLVCIVSFPPLIGYGTLITLSGMAFGGGGGGANDEKDIGIHEGSLREAWIIAASACLLGSFVSFNMMRSVLLTSTLGRKLTRIDALRGSKQWRAMEKAVGQRGLSMAILVRFSPFPFNVSNLFFASLQSISLANFMIATATTTPKLLLHVFIGSRLFQLVDRGSRAGLDTNTKILNGIYVVFGGLIGMATSWYVYHETNRILANYEQLEEEEEVQHFVNDGNRQRDTSIPDERRNFLEEGGMAVAASNTNAQYARRSNSSPWD